MSVSHSHTAAAAPDTHHQNIVFEGDDNNDKSDSDESLDLDENIIAAYAPSLYDSHCHVHLGCKDNKMAPRVRCCSMGTQQSDWKDLKKA